MGMVGKVPYFIMPQKGKKRAAVARVYDRGWVRANK
jgi:hypothetical protein